MISKPAGARLDDDTSGMAAAGSQSEWRLFIRRFGKNRAALIGLGLLVIMVIIAVFAPLISPEDPYATDLLQTLQGPSREHRLGTDQLGHDYLSVLIYASRVSILVGLLSTLLGLVGGVLFGLISGYIGGLVDTVISRILDIVWAFPGLLLAMALMAVLGKGMTNVILVLGVVSIPRFARFVRGSVLALKEREFVLAAIAAGARPSKIMISHILPNIAGPLVVFSTLGVGGAILQEASLSFLGVGIQPPMTSFGIMLSAARTYLFSHQYLSLAPGVGITMLVLAFNLVGDGLRDVLDPKMRRMGA